MSEKSTPSVRFDGFTNDWEHRKLGELFENAGSGGTPKSSVAEYYGGKINFLGISDISNSNGYIRQTAKTITEAGLKNSAAWIVPQGAISLAMYASVGKVAILGVDAATSQAFYNMVFHDDAVRDFVYQLLQKTNLEDAWRPLIATGTQPNLNAEKVRKFTIVKPTNNDEIKLINNYCLLVDSLVDLCQKKLDLLIQAKKALMQQIFSQKLRFKSDDGSDFPEWEKKRIGDVAFQLKKSIDPRNIPDQLFYEYSMPAFDEKKEPHLSYGYEMASSRKILDQSCLLINKLNVRKQRIWLVSNPQENAVSSAEFVPLSSRQVNLKFLNYLALSDRFTAYLMDSSSGSSNSQKRVTPDVIEDYEAAFPSLPEQQKIASCLSSADALLDQARTELEQWQEVKKSLLQQMFV